METKQTNTDDHFEIHVNQFDSQYDNRVTALGTVDWATLAEYGLVISNPHVCDNYPDTGGPE